MGRGTGLGMDIGTIPGRRTGLFPLFPFWGLLFGFLRFGRLIGRATGLLPGFFRFGLFPPGLLPFLRLGLIIVIGLLLGRNP